MAIVARSVSRNGGYCAQCRKWINKGEFIGKIATPGHGTTDEGNGAGYWVCYPCAMKHLHDEGTTLLVTEE